MSNYDQWNFKQVDINYDQKITNLETAIQGLNAKIPRTKFKFKRKGELQAKQKKRVENDEEKQDEFVKTIKGISDLKDTTLVLKQSDLENNFKLVNLENCVIRMEGHINMLFLRDLKNCEIHTCPVSNSVMGHFLNGCKISLIGHQIRLHDSYDTHFYVYTTSKLIIEDCSRLSFHELQYTYDQLAADIKETGLQGYNFWKDVQDFKWIKKERSPNFCLVFDGKEEAPEVTDATPVFNLAPKVKQEQTPTMGVAAMASNINDAHYHPGYDFNNSVDKPEPSPPPKHSLEPLSKPQPSLPVPSTPQPAAQAEPQKPTPTPTPSPAPTPADTKQDSDEEIDEL